MKIQEARALITGAAHGIGRATVLALVERGAQVALVDIDQKGLEGLAEHLEDQGTSPVVIKADVSDEQQVAGMVEAAMEQLGGLDIVVLNAGVSVAGPVESTPQEDWEWVMGINFWQHVYAVRACLPHMLAADRGHIVHVSSAAGILGTPGLGAYNASKFAVFGLAESLAISLSETGVDVSVVCPLWVDTDISLRGRMTKDPQLAIEVEDAKVLSRHMLRNAGIPPETVAERIVEAIEEGRFLVLPHPEVLKFAQKKWQDPERYIVRASETLRQQRQLFGER